MVELRHEWGSSADITQLHGAAAVVELLVGRLKRQSEVGDVLVRLLVVHPLHISDTFNLQRAK